MTKDETLAEEWRVRYSHGYFDENGLRPEFVQRQFMEPLAKAMADASPRLTRSQVRRFFQHCRAIERQLISSVVAKKAWGDFLSDLNKLDQAASSAFTKQECKIPRLFHDFIMRNVAMVQNERDFRDGFLRHFEALVGFGQQYFEDKGRN